MDIYSQKSAPIQPGKRPAELAKKNQKLQGLANFEGIYLIDSWLADLPARAKTQRVRPRRSGSVARKVETKREKATRTPPERAADPCSFRKLTRLARAGCGSAPLDNPGQSVWYLHIRSLLFEKLSGVGILTTFITLKTITDRSLLSL